MIPFKMLPKNEQEFIRKTFPSVNEDDLLTDEMLEALNEELYKVKNKENLKNAKKMIDKISPVLPNKNQENKLKKFLKKVLKL